MKSCQLYCKYPCKTNNSFLEIFRHINYVLGGDRHTKALFSKHQIIAVLKSVDAGRTVRPQQFDLTAAAAPEDEDMAGHRIVFQHRLHLCGETIEAVAHVGDTGNQPDFGACW